MCGSPTAPSTLPPVTIGGVHITGFLTETSGGPPIRQICSTFLTPRHQQEPPPLRKSRDCAGHRKGSRSSERGIICPLCRSRKVCSSDTSQLVRPNSEKHPVVSDYVWAQYLDSLMLRPPQTPAPSFPEFPAIPPSAGVVAGQVANIQDIVRAWQSPCYGSSLPPVAQAGPVIERHVTLTRDILASAESTDLPDSQVIAQAAKRFIIFRHQSDLVPSPN